MSIEIDLLSEVYLTLKQYIPQKDRQEASDNLMSVLVDLLPDDELLEFSGTDTYTKRSLQEFAPDMAEDEDVDLGYED
jgi:hypothetical protein